jgi:hypothetical protein
VHKKESQICASPDDFFHPEGWWRDRRQSHEFVMESIRWINSVLLGDLWRKEASSRGRGAASATKFT